MTVTDPYQNLEKMQFGGRSQSTLAQMMEPTFKIKPSRLNDKRASHDNELKVTQQPEYFTRNKHKLMTQSNIKTSENRKERNRIEKFKMYDLDI